MIGANERNSIASRLSDVFKAVLEVDVSSALLTPQACERWDSLNHIKLIIAIEGEFGFQLEIEDVELMYSSFDRCLDHVVSLLAG